MLKKIVAAVLALAMCCASHLTVFADGSANAQVTTTIHSAGNGHTLAIANDGSLWGWGMWIKPYFDKKWGSLDQGYSSKPVKIFTDVISVSCDDETTAVIRKDNSLWMWGSLWGCEKLVDDKYKTNGVLLNPVKVMDNVDAVSFGSGHTAILKTDGSLWLLGDNCCGQIGNDYAGDETYEDNFHRIYPKQTVPVKIMDDVISVSCGGDFTAAIKEDGSLWTWGCNGVSQLGTGEQSNGFGSVNGNAFIIHEDHSKDKHVPVKIMDDVVTVSCAHGHSAAIKKDGSLWTWGVNGHGDLGFGTIIDNNGHNSLDVPTKLMDNVINVYCGGEYTAALKADGSVWICGWDGDGIFHDATYDSGIGTPIKIMDNCVDMCVAGYDSISAVFGLNKDGSIYGVGTLFDLGTGKCATVLSSNKDDIVRTPVKILSNVARPSGVSSIVIPDIPSTWAKAEVEAAVSSGIVPENLQKNYVKPVSRGKVAELFINLIEETYDTPIDEILEEKGVEISEDVFSDTSDKNVLYANALGIINGTGNNKFSPNGTLTRAQVAAIINRTAKVLGIDTEGYSHNFTDVSSHWVDSELGWPVEMGIINGTGNNKFSPDAELTTEQTILIVYRALEKVK